MEKNKLLIILGIILSILSILCGATWLACALYIGLVLYLLHIYNEYTVIGFALTAVFQNIYLIIFAEYIDDGYMFILLLIKELLIYLVIIKGIYRLYKEKELKKFIKNNTKVLLLLGVLCICICVNIIKTSAGFFSAIAAVRQLAIPFTCFLMGYFLKIDENGYKKICKVIVWIAVFLTFSGIIEMILPENIVWQKLDYYTFLEKKQSTTPVLLYSGVTGNFYTWDFGFKLRRLVSITAEPLATAHLIFLGFLINLMCNSNIMRKKNKNYVITCIMLLGGCILGFSKGTFVYLGIVILALLYHKYGSHISIKKLVVILSVIVSIAVLAIVTHYSTATKPNAITNHLDGLLNGFRNSSLFGNGLGTAGGATEVITGENVSNAESYFGVVLNQIGYIGMFVMIICWLRIMKLAVKKYVKYKDYHNLMYVVLMLGLSIDMLLSESSVAVIGTGLYFILLGFFVKKST